MLIKTAIACGAAMVTIVTVAAHAQMTDGNKSEQAIKAAIYQTGSEIPEDYKADITLKKPDVIVMQWNEKPIDYNAREKDIEYISLLIKEEIASEKKRIALKKASRAETQYKPVASYNLLAPQISNDDCSSAIANAEKKYSIPPHMLQAIAITESGRGGKPDPWAMNIKGRAYYASGPQEVVNIVASHGSSSSIDIGCTQINLRWHGHRFSDWRQLLDPVTNAEYAAYHLTELKREFGGWSKAVSAYHSRTSWRGAQYACKVSSNYGKLFGDNRSGCGPDIDILASYLQNRV